MNKCIFIGNITRQPESRLIPSTGMAVCKFGLALNEGYGDKKKTYFINCVAFGKTAEATANYTDKGSKVSIESHVQTGSYKNKQDVAINTTDFVVDKIEFLTRKELNQFDERLPDPDDENVFQPVDDEDIPF
jgi:single-strand DNA-binding protein